MRGFLAIALMCAAVAACKPQASSPADPAAAIKAAKAPEASSVPSQPVAPTNSNSQVPMDLNALVPQGYKAVATEKGDLNGDGVADALLLVEDATNASEVGGEGAKRKLMILIGDSQGKYTVAATNDKIVPCKTCGGISGDPFSYMTIEGKGSFSVVVEGGSAEHWADTVDFRYSPEKHDWQVASFKKEIWANGDESKAHSITKAEGILFSAYDPKEYQEDKSP